MKLRPLSTSITEIPSLEFSSLNPDDGKYTVIKTEAIPIKILAVSVKPEANPPKVGAQDPNLQNQKEPQIVQPLEIPSSETLDSSDLGNLHFGTWWVLFLIPFGIGFFNFSI